MIFTKGLAFKYITFILIVFSLNRNIKAQESYNGTNVYLSPRITLGYTISSGFNYGFDLVVGIYQLDNAKFGIDLTYYMVNTNQGRHGIKGLALVADLENVNIKLGAGSVMRKWGLKNINKAKAPGIMIDVSGGVDPYKAPWIGVKAFIFSRAKWEFYNQPSYISAYTYFKTTEIEIFKEDVPVAGQ